jgi:hypothetical protein
MILTQL